MKTNIGNLAVLLGTLLFFTILFNFSEHFALAACTGTNKQLSANPSSFSQSSTWIVSFTLSEDANTYSIGYELSKGRLISGTTNVSFSGDVPCCYEKTIQTTPGIEGGIISLDFSQGPKLLLAGNVISLTITGITNPSSEPFGIDSVYLYSSAPNEPVQASCMVGSIYLSQNVPTATPTPEPNPTPLPTSVPTATPQPTATPIPPTQTPAEQNPTSGTQPTITVKKSPPPVTSKNQSSPTPNKTNLSPSINSQGTTPVNTPIDRNTNHLSANNQSREKEIRPEKMAEALILGELTTTAFFGLLILFVYTIKH